MADFGMETNAAEVIAELAAKAAALKAAGAAIITQTAQRVVARIPANMHWKSGDGTLAGSFYASSRGAESDLPYARRREFGFSGRTDSLGRHYTNDPGAFYMRATLATVEDDIDTAFTDVMTGIFG